MGILDAIFSAAFEGETPPAVPTWVEWEHVTMGMTHCPVAEILYHNPTIGCIDAQRLTWYDFGAYLGKKDNNKPQKILKDNKKDDAKIPVNSRGFDIARQGSIRQNSIRIPPSPPRTP